MKALIENRFGRLDILVNNAGIIHPDEPMFANSAEHVSLQALRETFEVNFFGQVALTQALLPLIRKSPAGRIVNVSSILGSLTLHSDESSAATQVKPLAYDASKTALNQFTGAPGCVAETDAHQGQRRTSRLGENGSGLPAGTHGSCEDGAKTAVRLAIIGPDGPTGKFFHLDEEIPW